VFLGDSLTAGYGLAKEESVPSLIQMRLRSEGYPYDVVNAGVSGDTSAGGLSRLDWSLEGDVKILVIELGANDGLRGLPVANMKRNLTEIITRSQSRGIRVLLTGMEAPPNFGAAYTAEFRQVYRDLAKLPDVTFMPFYLDGVAGLPDLNISDGMHPNAEGAHHRRRHMGEAGTASRYIAGGTPERDEMIELRGVSKTVQSGDHPLTILHPLDYTIPSGQFVAVVGPSGSGKSTLLGLLAGLDSPTTGEILIDGVDITRLSEDGLAKLRGDKIGFVFQFFHLVPSLTAFENVLIPMEISGRRDAVPRARRLLEEVGLTGRAHHYPSQLSGGEQQRIAIARALANDPPIVLADEPTGNLDSTTGRHIMELLLSVQRSRASTLVLVTHDADLAALADTRLVLRDGRPVTPDDALRNAGTSTRAETVR
jgi:putative ABC transport system ATP-binding protein